MREFVRFTRYRMFRKLRNAIGDQVESCGYESYIHFLLVVNIYLDSAAKKKSKDFPKKGDVKKKQFSLT